MQTLRSKERLLPAAVLSVSVLVWAVGAVGAEEQNSAGASLSSRSKSKPLVGRVQNSSLGLHLSRPVSASNSTLHNAGAKSASQVFGLKDAASSFDLNLKQKAEGKKVNWDLFAESDMMKAAEVTDLAGQHTRRSAAGAGLFHMRAGDSIFDNSEVVILLDRSGSMAVPDCQDTSSHRYLSRWNWVFTQLEGFAQELKSTFPKGFTVITFSDVSRRFEYCKEKDLLNILQKEHPVGGTRLAAALSDAFSERHVRGKCRRVVVISDGCPEDLSQVASELDSELSSTRNSDDSLRVTFLLVGHDPASESLARYLTTIQAESGRSRGKVQVMRFDGAGYYGLRAALEAAAKAEEGNSTDQHQERRWTLRP